MPSTQTPKAKIITVPGGIREARRLRANALKFMREYAGIDYDIIHLPLPLRPDLYIPKNPEIVKDILVTHAKKFHKSMGVKILQPLVGNGLLTSEGEDHKRQRKLSSHAFNREHIMRYADDMIDLSYDLTDEYKSGEVRNIRSAT